MLLLQCCTVSLPVCRVPRVCMPARLSSTHSDHLGNLGHEVWTKATFQRQAVIELDGQYVQVSKDSQLTDREELSRLRVAISLGTDQVSSCSTVRLMQSLAARGWIRKKQPTWYHFQLPYDAELTSLRVPSRFTTGRQFESPFALLADGPPVHGMLPRAPCSKAALKVIY